MAVQSDGIIETKRMKIKVEKSMESKTATRRQKQEQALEEAYRRGYHHGLARAKDLFQRLLSEEMPPVAALALCRAFEEQVIVPWRMDADTSSAPPVFDVEACQRLLRADKERQSESSS
jgi:hypothetical protein